LTRVSASHLVNSKPLGIGVIGLGHWGPNHVRTFSQMDGARVVMCADLAENRRFHISRLYRDLSVVPDADQVFANAEVDAVVIATPTHTHFGLAKRAMQAGKHVLLEKPMCTSMEEASTLAELSVKLGLTLMHGHVFVYNRAVQYLRARAVRGDFGNLQYLDAVRTNLGPIRSDIDVVQDLAVHEITIFDYLFGALPDWVQAAGTCPLGTPREDVAFITMEYGAVLAHAHVSWLHPKKVRTLTLVGDKRMVFWNDTDTLEPIRIYDKGLTDEPYYDTFGEFQLRLRDADILIPKIVLDEPLRVQALAFLASVANGTPSLSDAEAGIRVMRCLEAVRYSLKHEGKRVRLQSGASV
jgi:predicted dehydrogenase